MTYIPTPQNQVQAFAGALFGMAIDNPTMNAVLAAENAGVSGQASFQNSVFNATFTGPNYSTNAQIATALANNISSVAGWTTSSAQYTALNGYLLNMLNQNPGNQGVALNNALNLLGTLTNDSLFGSGATKWVNSVSAAGTYASISGNIGNYSLVTGVTASYNLTFGTDLVNAAALGIQNATFNAGLVNNGAGTLVSSLQSSDNLTGGSGTNVLNAVLSGGTTSPTLSNIQTLNVSNTNSGSSILDLSNATGVTNVNLSNLASNQSVANVQSGSIVYNISGQNSSNTGAVTISAGTGVAANSTALVTETNSANDLTISGSAFKTLALTAVGTNIVSSDTTAAITVAGSGSITLQGSGAASLLSNNINASALTGALTATITSNSTITGAAGGSSITGGSTGDTVIMTGSAANKLTVASLTYVSADVAITGSGGNNTLALSAQDTTGTNADKTFAAITGFQTLTLSSAGTNNETFGTGFARVGFTTLNLGTAGDTIQFAGATLNNLLVSSATSAGNTVNVGTSSGTITLNNITASTITGLATTVITETLTGTGTTTVVASGLTGASVILAGANETLNVSGASTITVNGTGTGNSVLLYDTTKVTLNASGNAFGTTVTENLSSASSITFGGGANSLRVGGFNFLSSSTAIVGGAAGTNSITLTAVSTGTDTVFTNVSGMQTLSLANGGANNLTLGTTFTKAGFSTLNLGTSGDTVNLYGMTLGGLTIADSVSGNDAVVIGTSSGTVTLKNIASTVITGAGVLAATLNGTGAMGVSAANTGDSLILSGTNQVLTSSGFSTITVNGTGTGEQVVLADATKVTLNAVGNAFGTQVTENATSQSSITFGAGSNNLIVSGGFEYLSSSTAIVGGGTGSTNTITLSAASTGTDTVFTNVSGIQTLTLSGAAAANSLTIGTNFVKAGFTTVNLGNNSGASSVVVNTALNGVTFSATNSGSDTLTLNTAASTLTVNNISTVTATGAGNQNLTIGSATSSTSGVGISFVNGATNVLTLANTTAVQTITVTNASSIVTNATAAASLSENFVLGGTQALTITGNNANNVINLGSNVANVTLQNSGTGNMSVVSGTGAATVQLAATDTVAIASSGRYYATGVTTINVNAANVYLGDDLLITGSNTTGDTVISTISLGSNNTGAFTLASTGGTTSGIDLVTINTNTGGDIITITNSSNAAVTSDVLINATNSPSTITLAAAFTGVETISVNATTQAAGTTLTNVFQSNWGTANDTINVNGITLKNGAGGTQTLLANYLGGTGVSGTNTISAGAFISGSSTSLANLTTGANQSGLIFEVGLTGSATSNFTTQAGINAAVSYITTNVGNTAVGANEQAIIAVADGSGHSALFLFSTANAATHAGISASELKLLGVVGTNTLSNTNFS